VIAGKTPVVQGFSHTTPNRRLALFCIEAQSDRGQLSYRKTIQVNRDQANPESIESLGKFGVS
jgi:hypothetical protein